MKSGSQPTGQSSHGSLPATIQTHDPLCWRWLAIAALLATDHAGLAGAGEIAITIAAYQALIGRADDRTPKRFRRLVRFL